MDDPSDSDVTDFGFERDRFFMSLALREAALAAERDEVPVGAVIVRVDESTTGDDLHEPLGMSGVARIGAERRVIAKAHNQREMLRDPTAHAEMLAITQAAEALDRWRLSGTVLYVTLEPCAMCAGAIVLARIPRIVYGADDPKAGACGSVMDVTRHERLNHRVRVDGGVMREECSVLLRDFFVEKRRLGKK